LDPNHECSNLEDLPRVSIREDEEGKKRERDERKRETHSDLNFLISHFLKHHLLISHSSYFFSLIFLKYHLISSLKNHNQKLLGALHLKNLTMHLCRNEEDALNLLFLGFD